MSADVIRLVTAGSVDDGKSTLVGRLLYDTRSVASDQVAAVARASSGTGLAGTDLALLVDGLRAEREQGITIDVAYRYFVTPNRTFVMADTPGHVQYTRNTVTGASTADHAVIVTDASKGMRPQTRRHLAVMAMLKVPSVTLAVNKLDLVHFSEQVYREINLAFIDQAVSLGYRADQLMTIPLSALDGDNVVNRSGRMPWYNGMTLLRRLETEPAGDRGTAELRMPVQYVLRDQRRDYRAYAGEIAAGEVRVGDDVVVLLSGTTTQVERIETPDGEVASAAPGSAVSLVLQDQIDVSRGDLVAAATRPPRLEDDFPATICWLADSDLHPGARLLVKQGTRTTLALVTEVLSRFDEQDLRVSERPDRLRLNEIGRVRLRVAERLPVDDYAECRATGAFILINGSDGDTVAAGMLGDQLYDVPTSPEALVG